MWVLVLGLVLVSASGALYVRSSTAEAALPGAGLRAAGVDAPAAAEPVPGPATAPAPDAPPVAATAPSSAPATPKPKSAKPEVRVVAKPVALPVILRIPDLEMETRLVGLRLDKEGSLEVPEDPDTAGWWTQGPVPGNTGASVIVGHVDSEQGPAIFADLRLLEPGDIVEVDRSDNSVVKWKVDGVETYSKDEFPTKRVYETDRKQLRLITCTGAFDEDVQHYTDNLVVYASPA